MPCAHSATRLGTGTLRLPDGRPVSVLSVSAGESTESASGRAARAGLAIPALLTACPIQLLRVDCLAASAAALRAKRTPTPAKSLLRLRTRVLGTQAPWGRCLRGGGKLDETWQLRRGRARRPEGRITPSRAALRLARSGGAAGDVPGPEWRALLLQASPVPDVRCLGIASSCIPSRPLSFPGFFGRKD
jgi:hypothetical protein